MKSSRKRQAEDQITRDNPELDAGETEGEGPFEQASKEVLSQRKLLKRRGKSTGQSTNGTTETSTTTSASTSGFNWNFGSTTQKSEETPKIDLKTEEPSKIDAKPEFKWNFAGDTTKTDSKSEKPKVNWDFTHTTKTDSKTEIPKVNWDFSGDTKKTDSSTEKPEFKWNFAADTQKTSSTTTNDDSNQPKFEFPSGNKGIGEFKWDFGGKEESTDKSETSNTFNSPFSNVGQSKEEEVQPWSEGKSYEPKSTSKQEEEPVAKLPEESSLKTGEEDEKTILKLESKLFELEQEEWKERGTGELKLNVYSPEGKKERMHRLLMRTKVGKLVLNVVLHQGIPLEKKTDTSILLTAMNHVVREVKSDEGEEKEKPDASKPTVFLLRFRKADEGTKIYDKLKSVTKKQGE